MTGRSSRSRKRDRSNRRRDSGDSRGRSNHYDGTPRDRRIRSPERYREARSPRRRDRSRSHVRSRRRRDSSYGSRDGSRDGALGKIIVRLNELEGRLSSSIVPPSTPTSRTVLECHTPPPPPAATGATPVVTEGSSGDTGAAKGDAADRIVGALSALLQTRSSNFYISSFDPSVHDFDSWCAEVDRARLLNKWDDGECLGRIGGCLRGDAKSWLHEWVTSERTWTNFKLEFRSLCPPSVDIASILFEVMCSNSNKYVTYAEYARKSLLRLKIVTGLSDDLRTAIIVRGITDPHVKAAATNAKLQSKDLVEFLSAYVKPKLDFNKNAPSNNSARSSQIRPSYPRKRDIPKFEGTCFTCGSKEHRKWNCPKKSKNDSLITKAPSTNTPASSSLPSRSNLQCTFCKRSGHDVDACFAKQRSIQNKTAGSVNFCLEVNPDQIT